MNSRQAGLAAGPGGCLQGLADGRGGAAVAELNAEPRDRLKDRHVEEPGRDHHPECFSMWLGGGGTARGRVVGKTADIGLKPVEGKVHVHDLQATLLHCLGFDHEKLTYRHQVRDFRLTDVGGRVVKEILT